MKPEKQELIHDLLDAGDRRETILLAGARVLRRRRRWRAARQGLTVLLMLTAAGFWLGRKNYDQPPLQTSVPPPKPPAQLQVHYLTDEELLALFPHTPVGLATLPNGKKILIFPRPEDEKRFITRL